MSAESKSSPGSWHSTDIQHLTPTDPEADISDAALKLQKFLGLIIKVSTATPSENDFASGIRCRKRVNRKKCPGFLLINRQDTPSPFIHWICDHSKSGGRIEWFLGVCL